MTQPCAGSEDEHVEDRLTAAWVFLRGEAREFSRTLNDNETAVQPEGRHLLMAAPLRRRDRQGGVGLVLDRVEAVGIASAMFQLHPSELSESDIDDACSEACNIMSACVAQTLAQGDEMAFERALLLPAEGYRRVARASSIVSSFEAAPQAGHVTLTIFDPLNLPSQGGEEK